MVPALSWAMVLGCDGNQVPRRVRAADKPVVPSRPGIVQVGGPHDVVTDEATACSRFRAALQAGITRLNCTNLELAECPELVHPLVELPCVMYSEPSVTDCERMFATATTCAELGPGGCVLTAILDPTDSDGIPLECADRDPTDTTTDSDSVVDSDSTLDPDSTASMDSTSVDTPTSLVDAGSGRDADVDASVDAGRDGVTSSNTSGVTSSVITGTDADASDADAAADASSRDAALVDELDAG